MSKFREDIATKKKKGAKWKFRMVLCDFPFFFPGILHINYYYYYFYYNLKEEEI